MLTTSSFRRTRNLVVTAGVALALLPMAAHAQQPIPGVVVATSTSSDIQRAMQHEAQGASDERKPSGWRSAASSYRRAAELRGNTPEAVELYRRAAWLYSAAGEHGKGREQLERSARIALDHGDMARAANTIFDAALMAATARDVRNTDATLQRLGVLLDAPLMPAEVRTSLKQRLAEPARIARR